MDVEEGVDTAHVHTRNKILLEERKISKEILNKKIRKSYRYSRKKTRKLKNLKVSSAATTPKR